MSIRGGGTIFWGRGPGTGTFEKRVRLARGIVVGRAGKVPDSARGKERCQQTMSLERMLAKHKTSILTRWFDLTVQTYPPDSRKFFKSQTNRFANPVGWTISEGMALIFDVLVAGQGLESQEVRAFLDGIIRIRAVQDFSPAEAVSFVYLLKAAAREALGADLLDEGVVHEFLAFESRIDKLALLAFDKYVECREKIFELRANELKNRTSRILARACQVWQARGECVPEDLEFDLFNKK